jgi:hypothetical protein
VRVLKIVPHSQKIVKNVLRILKSLQNKQRILKLLFYPIELRLKDMDIVAWRCTIFKTKRF